MWQYSRADIDWIRRSDGRCLGVKFSGLGVRELEGLRQEQPNFQESVSKGRYIVLGMSGVVLYQQPNMEFPMPCIGLCTGVCMYTTLATLATSQSPASQLLCVCIVW